MQDTTLAPTRFPVLLSTPHRGRSRLLRWLPLPWLAFVAWQWWMVIELQMLRHLPPETAGAIGDRMGLGLGMAAASKLVWCALEAGMFYGWWAALGERLPYWRYLLALSALSLLDVLGLRLILIAHEHGPPLASWLALLTGPAALEAVQIHRGSFAAAVGTVGLLTVTRVACTAQAQASLLGRRLRGPLILTVVSWLLSRSVTWLAVDLMMGRGAR